MTDTSITDEKLDLNSNNRYSADQSVVKALRRHNPITFLSRNKEQSPSHLSFH